MKMNSSYLISLMMISMSTIMSMMTNNWLFMWILMEINLFMFMPMMSKKKMNDQSIKYFIIQSFSSHLLVFSILMSSISLTPHKTSILILTSLLMKIGMSPFHFWLPEIMKNLKWKECFMLSTLIKITPMIFVNKMCSLNLMIIPMIMSMITGTMAGFNQFNLKKLMAYSSIFNLTWMTISFLTSKKLTLMFMVIYSLITYKIMKFFMKKNILYLNQLNHLNLKEKITMNLNMLSLMGLPPMMGFIPKWLILKEMIVKSNVLSTFMILTSLMSMFMYMQMNSFSFTNFSIKKKNIKKNKFKSLSIINLIFMPMIMMIMIN
uniref:NADH-ubiquinone oxidoreductase chain 2 n=1 Tax=Tropidocephala brunnipennis TaxID=2008871 RepID=A0A7S5DCG4_9HEMI|nr:NADH dehydrogenase subunit 2 [Tropidocephala brunnipennis]QBZ38043.1 NADH dehydrogenase subunit 2 [Tropidocephala brunnipennis]